MVVSKEPVMFNLGAYCLAKLDVGRYRYLGTVPVGR